MFFLDENQRVTWEDIGSREEIIRQANRHAATVVECKLESQFRCNGSDGYLAWLDNVLQVRRTANVTLEGIDYDFRVCNDVHELRSLIIEANKPNNSARMLAGYCWPWLSKNDPSKMDFQFEGLAMQWNLTEHGSLWLINPESVNQVGCIHTCQGLELDYVGVIVGRDLVVRNGTVKTDVLQRASQDKTWHGFKTMYSSDKKAALKRADEIVKNTYRVLMTRGKKGCFVWSIDPETNEWLRSGI